MYYIYNKDHISIFKKGNLVIKILTRGALHELVVALLVEGLTLDARTIQL